MSKKKKKPSHKKIFSKKVNPQTKIRVIGIGGGGVSVVSEIGSSLSKGSFIVADTDQKFLKKKNKKGIRAFNFGKKSTGGLGTGMDPELAKEAAEEEKERISKIFKDQDIVILISSLGGGAGSGAAPVFANLAQKEGAITLGIFTLPFSFEGKRKRNIAKKALKSLKGSLNALIVVPNQRIFKIIDEDTPIVKAFSGVNKNLIENLESLIEIISKPGIINIDFADIRTILKKKNKLVFLNTVESSGKDRAEEIVKKIFQNPLSKYDLKAEKILFNIQGGSDLKMTEVEKISQTIAEANPRSKIIFGISKKRGYKNKIRTTLLIVGEKKKKRRKKKKKKTTFSKKTKKKKTKRKTKKKNKSSKKRKTKKKRSEKIKKKTKKKRTSLKKKKKNTKKTKKKTTKKKRRTALEIKKEQEEREKEKIAQEKQWEIPAFLRKLKK